MKRALLAILCSAVLLTHAPGAIADPASDQDMASRYLRAAQSGDDEAEFYVGALYSAGVGVPRSDKEAFRWFGRAADQGHSHAMLILAGLYAIGRGVERNNIESYKWAYIVSGASRVDEFRDGARQLMSVLESRMTSAEINLARTEASRWHAVATGKLPPAGPATSGSRTTPAFAAPASAPPITTAAPVAPAPSPSSQPSAQISDIDSFLKEVPSGVRKKLGF
ncbi:MAG TPA: tetratricopeptide repeat protein [Bradyrhizobium sp.]|uniref:tetratricopeptide repeat protein n=1 Tax=Bradyrhizobium sp. TaxID=376 RepID=UPI002BF1046A|nr:tetratricopeptide repeat protein [Bradyrhizobium sp.]HLZ06483.1 tetratricopeptide repeat protein [Bradyrhizobium sp.]